jgi:hypothetical protein
VAHHGAILIPEDTVANRPSIPVKEIVGSSAALDEFTRRILSVPHSAIKAQLDAEKAAKRTSTKRSASRVSGASPKRAR